ncbi:serine/threonine-protein kinase [Streptomyces sp. NPDC050263]|uniref:serine/threonine-protein kinase n=1 Tax=Streptomyces sp. NPDC050263 TaxID=3155037 RepID=UPI00343794D8
MGRVWRATDEVLDRQVAVKEMRIDGLDSEDTRTRRERTLREARATARIDHPNVVRVYDVVDEGERLWIVMELVAGRSLERIMAEEGPLGPHETARIGLGLVMALRQVHAGGVLHRDIKPGNVLVENAPSAQTFDTFGNRATGGRRVVLTDFGIAAIQDAKALTMVGMLVGSPDYMAPERISGSPQGPPSDVWSLGATLCAALAGHSPFSRETTLATLHAVLYEEPRLPVDAGPLQAVLATLLKKDPAARPTLTDLESALAPIAFPPPAEGGGGPEEGPAEVPVAGPAVLREPPTRALLDASRAPAPPEPPDPSTEAASEMRSESGSAAPFVSPSPTPSPSAPPRSGVSLARSQAETERRPFPEAGEGTPAPRSAVRTRRAGLPSGGELPGPAVPAASGSGRGGRTAGWTGRRRRTGAVAALGVVAVGTVVAIVLASAPGAHDGDDDRAGGASPKPSPVTGTTAEAPATPSLSPSSTVEGTFRPPSLPPGTHQEAGGFAWATPKGWRRDVKTGAEVHYTSPDGTQELVAKSSLARGDLIDTWQTSERNAQQGQDYRKIRLEETTFRGLPAVVWEYTFTLQGTPWHARLLGFNEDGRSFQINTWYQPETETAAMKTYERVKDSFKVM